MSNFDPDIQTHLKLVKELEQKLGEDGNISVETPALADKLAGETDTGLKRDTIYSIINSGSTWIEENTDVVVESRRGGTGGSATKYWRLE